MHDYAAELNPEQYAAVTTTAERALVIAGAGSGKTRTLTYRVAWLLEHGVAPWRILLLTFTNKAAREMLERVTALTGTDANLLWSGTFHSIANRLLRRYATSLGYQPGFTIFDSDDQRALMKNLVKQFAGKMTKADRFPKPELLLSLHSLAINTATDWHRVLTDEYPYLEQHEDTIGRIFAEYTARKKALNVMDFDDLLTNLLRLLEEHAELRAELQERFRHILVDEYQDTNTPQDRIVQLLAGGSGSSLMAVGDDAQSIYSWRGADVQHILHFQETYPQAEIYHITTNYRSLPPILELSNAAIAQNENQIPKDLQAARCGTSFKPVVVPAPDNRTEAAWVAHRIDELLAGGIPGSDIAVLYRAHFHSMDLQMELTRAHIPFRITSGLRFFEQAHVKDVIAFLRLLSNPRDEIAFRRIVGTFPRVGEATAGKIWAQWLATYEKWAGANPEQIALTAPHTTVFAAPSVKVAPAIAPHWAAFLALMDSLHPADHTPLPAELIRTVITYLNPYFTHTYDNFDERSEDLMQITRNLGTEDKLDEFLANIALLSEVDSPTTPDSDTVTLSTIHQAKGLEWKIVFIIFLGEGQFPHRRVIESGSTADIEEETRLFYVAVTRAQDQLYLTFPRYNGRSYDAQYSPPSRFLTTLPQELIQLWAL